MMEKHFYMIVSLSLAHSSQYFNVDPTSYTGRMGASKGSPDQKLMVSGGRGGEGPADLNSLFFGGQKSMWKGPEVLKIHPNHVCTLSDGQHQALH